MSIKVNLAMETQKPFVKKCHEDRLWYQFTVKIDPPPPIFSHGALRLSCMNGDVCLTYLVKMRQDFSTV